LRTLSIDQITIEDEPSIERNITIRNETKSLEDKYIDLLRQGLIGKEEFMAFIGQNPNKPSDSM